MSTPAVQSPSTSPPPCEYSFRTTAFRQLQKALESNDYDKFLTILHSKARSKGEQFSLLIKAIDFEDKRLVLALLDANCHVTKNDHRPAASTATTPLHLAATKPGWTDVVERLLARGCRADDRSSRGTPLHLAFHAGNCEETVDALLKSYVADLRARIGRNLGNWRGQLGYLHIACTRPSVEVVQKLVESRLWNYLVNSRYSASQATPLHFAVTHKRYEIAHYLNQSGADMYLQNKNGSTPLHLALEMGDVQMIDLLLACDMDKRNVVDRFGATHFMAACAGSNPEIVQEFLYNAETRFDLSPDTLIFAQMNNHASKRMKGKPLHFASYFGRIDTVKMLLNYGAECCLATANGLDCHAIAEKRKHKQIRKILKEHCKVIKKCRKLRAQSPDFGKWGEKHELHMVLERTRTLKSLRNTLRKFRSVSTFDAEVIDISS